jgi:hypothetical protein
LFSAQLSRIECQDMLREWCLNSEEVSNQERNLAFRLFENPNPWNQQIWASQENLCSDWEDIARRYGDDSSSSYYHTGE